MRLNQIKHYLCKVKSSLSMALISGIPVISGKEGLGQALLSAALKFSLTRSCFTAGEAVLLVLTGYKSYV